MDAGEKLKQNETRTLETGRIMRRICLLEFCLGAVIVGSICCVFYFHKHIENDRRLFNEYLLKSHLWVTEAHLLFDEIMHHTDTNERMDLVTKLLDDTNRNFQAIINAQVEVDWFYVSFDKAKIKNDIIQLQDILMNFMDAARQEHNKSSPSKLNLAIHKRHDVAFDRFDEKMDELESYVSAAIIKETHVFSIAQKILIVFALLMAVVLGGFLARDIRGHTTADEKRSHFIGSLESENRELTGIVDISSHDLRSPLINIQGFANELETDCIQLQSILQSVQIPSHVESDISHIIDESIPESLNYINLSAARMDSLLKGLLKLSRLGRAATNIETLDMNLIVGEIVNTMQYRIKEHNIEVSLDELPPCLGDQSQIAQVFANLIDNAIKYLGKSQDGIIHISGMTDDDRCIYCVQDNGKGISPRDHEKIFQVFHRVDANHSVSGEGLGLTIVKRIAERHRGDVWVESDIGDGCRFYVALPKSSGSVVYEEMLSESKS